MDKSLEKLEELSRCFQQSRILLTAVELGLFDHLEQPLASAELAARVGVGERALGILLDALAALKLIAKDSGRYRNGEAVSKWLVSGKPDWRGAIFRHTANYWAGWNQLTRTIRGGHEAIDEHQREGEEQRAFILGMHAIARDLAPRLAAMLPLPESGEALDIGGGPGTYAMAFCRARPKLRVTIFDRPSTEPIARDVISREGAEVAQRIGFRGGDFTADPLGSGYQFAWMSQVLHAYSEEECAALIAKAAAALSSGGTLAVHEFALGRDKTSPLRAALFSVHMLLMTPGGRAYGREEIGGWLRQAGLRRVSERRASGSTSLILGSKP